MKLAELQQNKVTNVRPGQSAEIDHGDGTKTVVDLKKNPNALSKDPASGKVQMKKSNSAGGTNKPQATIKPGDQVEIEEKRKDVPTGEIKLGRPSPSKNVKTRR